MKNLTLENLTKVCGGVYSGPSDKLEQVRLLPYLRESWRMLISHISR